mmetsp:Transcript_25257/g.58351  ORF Transcript_25257/g.58351 Transcript_25257/m.58351 type:complete len:627 (-) Transcript_25257:320-2200(-)
MSSRQALHHDLTFINLMIPLRQTSKRIYYTTLFATLFPSIYGFVLNGLPYVQYIPNAIATSCSAHTTCSASDLHGGGGKYRRLSRPRSGFSIPISSTSAYINRLSSQSNISGVFGKSFVSKLKKKVRKNKVAITIPLLPDDDDDPSEDMAVMKDGEENSGEDKSSVEMIKLTTCERVEAQSITDLDEIDLAIRELLRSREDVGVSTKDLEAFKELHKGNIAIRPEETRKEEEIDEYGVDERTMAQLERLKPGSSSNNEQLADTEERTETPLEDEPNDAKRKKKVENIFSTDTKEFLETFDEEAYTAVWKKHRIREILSSSEELRAEELNVLLAPQKQNRHRIVNKPDSGYAAIFHMEGTLLNLNNIQMEAWCKVAKENKLRPPTLKEVAYAQTMSSEKAAKFAFRWSIDFLECRRLAIAHCCAMQEVFDVWMEWCYPSESGSDSLNGIVEKDEILRRGRSLFPLVPEAENFITNLVSNDLSCGLISRLARNQVERILDVTGTSCLFSTAHLVCADDGRDRESQRLLNTAIKLCVPPDHCVAFGLTPQSAIEAHEASMRCVSFVGMFPQYELAVSDLNVRGYEDMTIQSFRRVFSDRLLEETEELELEREKEVETKVRRRDYWGEVI